MAKLEIFQRFYRKAEAEKLNDNFQYFACLKIISSAF